MARAFRALERWRRKSRRADILLVLLRPVAIRPFFAAAEKEPEPKDP